MCKRPHEALRAFERAIELDARLFDAHYHFARFCAGRGDHARAVELGFRNTRWIMNDHDFAPLHDHPRFKEIMADGKYFQNAFPA